MMQQSTADLEITTSGITFEGEDWLLVVLALIGAYVVIILINAKYGRK